MKIKDAENRTGINSNTIRYYEEVGLVVPSRNQDNDYREYNLKDIERLLEIKFLRNLQMPIKTIIAIYENRITLDQAVKTTLEELEAEKEKLEISIDLLTIMSEQGSKTSDVFSNKVFDYQKPHPFINFVDNINNIISRHLPILRFGFLPSEGINSSSDFVYELVNYARTEEKHLEILKVTMLPTIRLNGVLMQAVLVPMRSSLNYKVVKFKVLKEV